MASLAQRTLRNVLEEPTSAGCHLERRVVAAAVVLTSRSTMRRRMCFRFVFVTSVPGWLLCSSIIGTRHFQSRRASQALALVEPVLRLGLVAQRAERTCVVCKAWSRPSRCARADATMSASAASKAYRELLVVQRRLFGADMQARMAARVETRAQFMLHARRMNPDSP